MHLEKDTGKCRLSRNLAAVMVVCSILTMPLLGVGAQCVRCGSSTYPYNCCPAGQIWNGVDCSGPGCCGTCCPTPAGSYVPNAGCNKVGTPCPTGTFNPKGGQSTCTPCAAGTYNPSIASTSSDACLPCAAGSYSVGGQPSCTPCPAGTYNPNTASTAVLVCVACSPGTYCFPNGSANPVQCPPSYFCPNPAEDKRICPAGSYCPASSSAPNFCQTGFLCDQQGLAQQVVCPPGHYCPSAVQSVPCPSGTFSTATGVACSHHSSSNVPFSAILYSLGQTYACLS